MRLDNRCVERMGVGRGGGGATDPLGYAHRVVVSEQDRIDILEAPSHLRQLPDQVLPVAGQASVQA